MSLDLRRLKLSLALLKFGESDAKTLANHSNVHYRSYTKTKNKSDDDQEAEADALRKEWGFKKKQLCQTYPKECLNCFNPHCSESKTGRI